MHHLVHILFGTWDTHTKGMCVSELSPSSLRVGPDSCEGGPWQSLGASLLEHLLLIRANIY